MNRQNPSSTPRWMLRCAETLSEVERAWGLVYHAYLAQGIIHSNPFGIHATAPAASRHGCVVYGSVHGQVVSTLTMIRDSDAGLPLNTVVRNKLDQLRASGRRLVETGMLANRYSNAKDGLSALFELMSWAIYGTLHQGADDMVIGVHPRHVVFYERAFQFERLTQVLRYRTFRDKPVVLLRLRVREQMRGNAIGPRAIAFAKRHPVGHDIFSRRYTFPSYELAGSSLAGFLTADTSPGPVEVGSSGRVDHDSESLPLNHIGRQLWPVAVPIAG